MTTTKTIAKPKTEYCLGIEFHKCDKYKSGMCLRYLKYGDCKSALNKCFYPLSVNPLCNCKSLDQCNRSFTVITHNKRTYILYYCSSICKFYMKAEDEVIEKILKQIDSEYIYFGKALDKLVKKIVKKSDVRADETTRIVQLFEKAFKGLGIQG